ncbi:MAG: MipA/OmpV family protein [Rhizobiales bacterium]|nr:MipA/OmpV family protein [Hyphomicrobiales bacterium]MBO6699768.1 MipA/OmpV family protein [Hyphomicrobiales bacterium]MBO6737306.1 MipA/OmpV family protein [Hyphomicrobiales bacterium]MBO6911620.1 MipA/OmpV family protein [Hyphomicrobiales bacterium]MBO6954958.1 MipA/OmpV family protein [Hyphomicrobiales bacterium]
MTKTLSPALIASVALASLAGTPALAQSPFDRVEQGWHFFGQGGQPAEVRLGLGAGFTPDYQGSDEYRVMALPVITARNVFGFNFTPFALSYNLAQYNSAGGAWSVGFGPRVAFDFGRDQDDNVALAGLGDVDSSILPGGFVNLRLGPALATASFGQDVADGHDGAVVDLGLSTFVPVTQQITLMPGITASWADDDYMQSYFGITAAQAATSAYGAYNAEAGLKSVGANVNAIYAINENWAANTRLSYERLLGDAADSPIVDGPGSANQFSVMFGVTRGFSF